MAMVPPPPDPSSSGSLVERDHELAVLDAALSGPGRLVAIEAPPGMGKSALMAAIRARAAVDGRMVLSATGVEMERQVAFGVAGQLFAPLVARATPQRRATLLESAAAPAAPLFAGKPTSPGDTRDNGEGLIQGLYWLAENLAAEDPRSRPLVLAVDDGHWSDEASLRFLARLANRLPGVPVLLVVALRPGEQGASPVLEQLTTHPAVEILRPAPLTPAGVEALVRARFPKADGAFARACSRASGGNPFFLRALLTELVDEAVEPTAEAAAVVDRLVPGSASRAILVRLARLPGPAIALARAVAILGDRTPLTQAAALADLDDAAAENAADALTGANLLGAGDPLGFTHPLIGAAVEADLPSFARARTHRRAAALLAAASAPPGAVAAHLLACRAQGDPWVVHVLRAAAEAATAAGDHRGATALLARAVQEPPGDADRASVHVALALAQAGAGQPGSDEALSATLAVIDQPGDRAEALLALSRLLIGKGDFGGAADAAERGLADVGGDDPLGQRLLNMLLIASSRHAPRRREALGRFEPLLSAARAGQVPSDRILCARLASRMATAGEPAGRVADLARSALADDPLVDPATHGIPFAFVAAGIYWIGEFAWCKQAADTALEAARRQGSPLGLMAASHWQAAACRQLGLLGEAVVHADRGLAIHRDGWDALVGWTGAFLVATHLERGDLPAARRALAVAETVDHQSLDWAFVLAARGSLALATDEPASALADLEEAGRHLAQSYRIDHPGVLRWRSLAAAAMAQLGRMDEARELARAELAQARGLGLPLPLGRSLRMVGLLTPGPPAIDLLEEAVAVLRSSQAVLAQAQALIDFGALLRRSDERVASRQPLAEGLRLAETFGAGWLRSRAEAELHAAGGRRRERATAVGASAPSVLSLTPTQHRVAQLAAQGLTNVQIAQRLYVTTKTVEWHLSQVYRDLGVTGRRPLAAVVGTG